MKFIKLLPLIALVLVGCDSGAPTKANYDKVKVGMTRQEVHSLLGEPAPSPAAALFPDRHQESWSTAEYDILVNYGVNLDGSETNSIYDKSIKRHSPSSD
jgi:hypothetical protein